jgi:hypothetical protein
LKLQAACNSATAPQKVEENGYWFPPKWRSDSHHLDPDQQHDAGPHHDTAGQDSSSELLPTFHHTNHVTTEATAHRNVTSFVV